VLEDIPVIEVARAKAAARGSKTRIVYPTCPEVATPGERAHGTGREALV